WPESSRHSSTLMRISGSGSWHLMAQWWLSPGRMRTSMPSQPASLPSANAQAQGWSPISARPASPCAGHLPTHLPRCRAGRPCPEGRTVMTRGSRRMGTRSSSPRCRGGREAGPAGLPRPPA
ncbi:hypothetical protein, partial [Arthrobacter sp. DR-2P]